MSKGSLVRDKVERGFIEKYGCKSPFSSEEIKEKIKKTCIKRYGTDNPFKSDEIKGQIKTTNIERYGVENPASSETIKNKVKNTNLKRYGGPAPIFSDGVKEKIKKSNLERYGVENVSQSGEIKNKIKKTNLDRYGVECSLNNEKIKDKIKNTNLKKFGAENVLSNESIIRREVNKRNVEKYGVEYPLQSKEIREKALQSRLKENYLEGFISQKDLIEKYGQGWYKFLNLPKEVHNGQIFLKEEYEKNIKEYNDRSKSVFEYSVKDFVKSLIESSTINFNDRATIYPYELDIYIPEKKIAIECNGTYWHSTKAGKDVNYHLDKTRMCESKGIRLIHIFEWEWENKRFICESIISSALGIYKDNVNSEDCEIKEVNNEIAHSFLIENSILENIESKFNLGLFFKKELVQVISISNKSEIVNTCTKKDTKVVNGTNKLIEHLPKGMKEVYLYLDRSKFDWKEYCNNGWEFISEVKPKVCYPLENSSKIEINKLLVYNSGQIKLRRCLSE